MGQRADELRTEIDQTRTDLGDTLEAIGEKVSPRRMVERRMDGVRNGMHSVRNAVMGSADSVGSSTRSGMQEVRAKAGSAVESVENAVTSAPAAVADQTRGNPLAAGLVAFGLGALAATVIPTSRMERDMGESAAQLIEPVKGELQEAGRSVMSSMKDTAQERVQEVQQTASDVASDVKGQAQDAVSHVQDEAKSGSGNGAEPETTPQWETR